MSLQVPNPQYLESARGSRRQALNVRLEGAFMLFVGTVLILAGVYVLLSNYFVWWLGVLVGVCGVVMVVSAGKMFRAARSFSATALIWDKLARGDHS